MMAAHAQLSFFISFKLSARVGVVVCGEVLGNLWEVYIAMSILYTLFLYVSWRFNWDHVLPRRSLNKRLIKTLLDLSIM